MKAQLVLPVTLFASVILVGFIKIRKKEYDKEEKMNRFQDIKLRVTNDVLQEYQNEEIDRQKKLEKTQTDLKNVEEEVTMLQTKAEKTKGDADVCLGAQKTDADQVAASEANLNGIKAELEKEMAELTAEIDDLKKQLAGRSAVCNFLKEIPDPVKDMCGIKDEPKAQEQEQKAEPPKQEEKKEEPPKQEEKKEEPPKQEEKKEEPPKQEEKKEEPPKQEGKKEEPPKQEEKKEEPPKQEEKKAEPPKQ
ncbi:eukaryotic translation initiation factor 5B [Kryptolebias marmoratus]|uniref:Zgc:174935 n=1 Tax=Kryptolebias marmoratus TaxID=37003 RepID=A0A3Q3A0V7_KRYMA|nr:eukaryotic translation initiation factor 5B [Kryptolebias marmoratus]